jgi:hypothetical protein
VIIAGALLLLSAASTQSDFFTNRVEPILRSHCVKCHNHELDDGDISFEDRATLLRDRPSGGAAIVPGAPEKSALVRAIRHNGDKQMPPGAKLPQRDIDTLIKWIRLGAPWAAGGTTK